MYLLTGRWHNLCMVAIVDPTEYEILSSRITATNHKQNVTNELHFNLSDLELSSHIASHQQKHMSAVHCYTAGNT